VAHAQAGSTLHTETASREAAEQAIAPTTHPDGSNSTIQGILVTTCGHRGDALRRMRRRSDVVESTIR
jgi:hypothetical protein